MDDAAGGTSNFITTYKDKYLTAPNAQPIVLDTRGECELFVNQALRLYICTPGSTGIGDGLTQSEDWLAEQQADIINYASAYGNTSNNNYVGYSVPYYSSIPQGFMLSFTPDKDNIDTLLSQKFTGTGINDGIFSGPYLGSTVGSIFNVTIDSAASAPPTTKPNVYIPATAGIVTAGVHNIAITFVTATGETSIGPSAPVNMPSSKTISVSNIPLGGINVTARNVYMTQVGGSTYYLVGTISDNTTTTFTINVADTSLSTAAPPSNTTGAGGADTFKWNKDGGTETTGVPIAAGTPMYLQENVSITFAFSVGHVFGDSWVLQVMTPAKLNFDGLGNWLIYKIAGGKLVALDGSDMKANVTAFLSAMPSQQLWLLINPSLILSDVALTAHGIAELNGTPWVCPSGVTTVYITGAAPGGGGGAGATGMGGTAGQWVYLQALNVVPGTSYPNSLGTSGIGGAYPGYAGGNATNATFDSLLTLTGGTGGISGGSSTTAGGDSFFGAGGAAGAAGGAGGNGVAPGTGGGGGDVNASGGNGGPGRLILEW